MKRYFADTSYWIALLNQDDEFHVKAKELGQRLRGAFVTTRWVLLELLDGFSNQASRAAVALFVRSLEESSHIVVVPATEAWWEDGLVFFESRKDKDWSLTDCLSFLVMEELEIGEALTADHHFEQAGFVALLNDGK